MRIVYLNPVGFLGGGELSLLDLMASTRKAAPKADLHLIVAAPGLLAEEAAKLGVTVTLVPMPDVISAFGDSGLKAVGARRTLLTALKGSIYAGPAIWRYSRSLSEVIQYLKPTIIHSNGIKTHLLTRNVQDVGAGVVWHVRDYISPRPFVANILRFNSSNVSIIAISKSIQEDVALSLNSELVEVIYDSIDTVKFSPDPTRTMDLDAVAGLPPAPQGTLRIGLVATYAKWKGHDVLLKAAAEIIKIRPDLRLRFYIVGDPIYKTAGSQWTRTELSDLATSLGLSGHVGFIPFQKKVEDVFRTFDIPVHASVNPEPFGRTIAEAMACGKSAIVSASGGAAELFVHDRDAVGVPAKDVPALTAAILRLADNPALRATIGANARLAASTRFHQDRIGPEVLAFYDRLIARLPARRKAKISLAQPTPQTQSPSKR